MISFHSLGSICPSGENVPNSAALPTRMSSRLVALVDGGRELVDLDEVPQVERHQRGAAAGGADLVVDLFEPAGRARRQYQMCTLAGEALGDGGADAARGAGDKRDFAGEPPRHHAGEGASFSRALRAARRWIPHSAMPLIAAVTTR